MCDKVVVWFQNVHSTPLQFYGFSFMLIIHLLLNSKADETTEMVLYENHFCDKTPNCHAMPCFT